MSCKTFCIALRLFESDPRVQKHKRVTSVNNVHKQTHCCCYHLEPYNHNIEALMSDEWQCGKQYNTDCSNLSIRWQVRGCTHVLKFMTRLRMVEEIHMRYYCKSSAWTQPQQWNRYLILKCIRQAAIVVCQHSTNTTTPKNPTEGSRSRHANNPPSCRNSLPQDMLILRYSANPRMPLLQLQAVGVLYIQHQSWWVTFDKWGNCNANLT